MKLTCKSGQLIGKASLAIAASAVAVTTLGACSGGVPSHHGSPPAAPVTAGVAHQKAATAPSGATVATPTHILAAGTTKAATTMTIAPPLAGTTTLPQAGRTEPAATVPETTIVTGGETGGTSAPPAAVAKENNNPFWAAVQQGALKGIESGVSEACHNIMGPPKFTCPAGN